jgi:Right handed beta helix region
VQGNNANPGTQAAPKRDLAGINVNTLAGGTSLLFARGGSWNFALEVDNRVVTEAAPLTFADYGAGPLPLLRTPSGNTFTFGRYNNGVIDGGYVFRNLRFDGTGTGTHGAMVQGGTRGVVFDGVEVSGFTIGIHIQGQATGPNDRLTIRNSFIHHNSDHGVLGAGNADFVFEGNRVEDNNPSGGGFEHGTYFSPGPIEARNARIVGNVYRRNSAPGGVCNGGNMTLHGIWDGLLIEGNTVEQADASGGCYGLSITSGYSTVEYFRNTTVRNNTTVNVGNCSVCISAAPGILVEGNRAIDTRPTGSQVGVLIPATAPGAGDAVDGGAVIRNNTLCQSTAKAGSEVVRAPSAGSVTGNVYQTTGTCAR